MIALSQIIFSVSITFCKNVLPRFFQLDCKIYSFRREQLRPGKIKAETTEN